MTMPTPAIAKAAEEIALRFCGDSTASGSDFIEPVKEILTRHFATAPAPDDGPITEEWLRGLGFEPNPKDPYGYSLRIEIPNRWVSDSHTYLICEDRTNAANCPWSVNCYYDDGTEPDSAMLISELPTQAEVLSLCKVLRIALNTPAPSQPGSE